LYKIKQFFGCGTIRKNNGDRYCIRFRKFEHLLNVIIPFFVDNQLLTRKKIDFINFRYVIVHIMLNKLHLTEKGRRLAIKIANRMNRKRIRYSP